MKTIDLGYMSIETGSWEPGYDYNSDTDERMIKDLDPNEIIIKKHIVEIKYDYPLSVSHKFKHHSTNIKGFTRKELSEQIMKHYKDIYKEEEEIVGNPGHIPGMLNRRTSDGPHGIWGHDIGDLILHTIHVRDGTYTLGIDS
jgi:hypothetical protein